jgi:starch phosphorylase
LAASCAHGKHEIAGAANAALYQARTPANRPAQAFTPRVVPWHPCALVPLEATRIRWCR